MRKSFFVLVILILFTAKLCAHNEEKMSIQTNSCSLAEVWLSDDEEDFTAKIEKLREVVREQKKTALSVPQLDQQNTEILEQLLMEDSPEEISRLVTRHLEIENAAIIYSRNKLTQINVILILIINIFVIATIWLAFVSNSSKNKALREKKINDQILAAQERERKRIAQELHDTITQDIRTALLYVRELKDNQDDKSLPDKIEALETQNLKNLRNIIQNLTSAEIETEDFGKIISQHCATVSENRKIPCSFFAAPEVDFNTLTTIQKLNILRIIQEAVNNSLKHAKASSINIIVRKDARTNCLIFFMSDDGQGMDAAKKEQSSAISSGLSEPAKADVHYGLTGMKYRADMINAKLQITSSAEMGTEIKLTLPL